MNRLPQMLFNGFIAIQNRAVQKTLVKSLHRTGVNCSLVWRRNRRLPRNPTSSGPLTDLPDYSFMDGRITPLGTRQKGRLDQQRSLAQKIVQGIYEVDFAKANHERRLAKEEAARQSILDNKLKPKGRLLLKKDE